MSKELILKKARKIRRHKRIRSRVLGTKECPRLSVFRSNKHVYAQLIDDVSGKTLLTISSLAAKSKNKSKKTEDAKTVGTKLSEQAKAKGIKRICLDRGGFAYHGRVKALAEAAREGGLEF